MSEFTAQVIEKAFFKYKMSKKNSNRKHLSQLRSPWFQNKKPWTTSQNPDQGKQTFSSRSGRIDKK